MCAYNPATPLIAAAVSDQSMTNQLAAPATGAAGTLKKLAAQCLNIDTVVADILKKESRPIDDTLPAHWLKLAGAEGNAIIDAYNKT